MFILQKIADMYQNDLVIMLQINALTIVFGLLLYDYWKARNNPLSKQVLDRMKKSKQGDKKKLDLTNMLSTMGSKLHFVEKKAELRLSKANLEFTSKEYVSFFIIGAIVGATIGFVVFPFSGLFKEIIFFLDDNYLKTFVARILSAVSFGLLGTLAPMLWTKRLISKRNKELNDQLLEFLLSLADGVKSSPTVTEALKMVATEIPNPLSKELNLTVQELQYAKPFETAMQNLAERIGIKEYSMAINAMQIQSQTGGELEKLLRNMAKVFQERQELMAEVKKIVRGPKTTSYILLAAPFALTLMFSMMSDNFFGSLFSSPIGWGCIIAAIVMYIIAFFLITRINKYVDKVV